MTAYRVSVPSKGQRPVDGEIFDAPSTVEAARAWANVQLRSFGTIEPTDLMVVDPIGRKDRLRASIKNSHFASSVVSTLVITRRLR